MEPLFLSLPFSYKKPDTEVWVFNNNVLPFPSRKIKDQQLIILGPGAVGGNHKHPRTEWFIAMSAGLKLFWLDEKRKVHERDIFSDKEELMLVEVPPYLPHAVKNTGTKDKVILLELADDQMKNPQFVEVI